MTILHQFGDWLRSMLQSVPLSAVRGLFLATLAGLLVWVLMLPSSRTTPDGLARRWDENLKLGAALALGMQLLAYALL